MNCPDCGAELNAPHVWCGCGRDFRHKDERTKKLVADRPLTSREYKRAYLRLKKWGFRWVDAEGCIRKYRRPVEGVFFLLTFLGAGSMAQRNPGIADPHGATMWVALILLWGVAQIIINDFSSYDLDSWVRHPTPQLLLGFAFLFGILPGVVLYFVLRNSERRFIREAARKSVGPVETCDVETGQTDVSVIRPASNADRVRWYHILVAILLPHVAPAWGVLKLIRGQRRSGFTILFVSIAVMVFFAAMIMISLWANGAL